MKPIKMTAENIEGLMASFKSFLETAKVNTTTINFSCPVTTKTATESPKPTIKFSQTAWDKMRILVEDTPTEIAWHGLVMYNEEHTEFEVLDIMMYPQYVSAATVNTDETKYADWLDSIDDDSINFLRFQGHSHVDFAPSPSSVDTNYYNDMLQMLGKDDFYIFMILNKKHDFNIWLYDIPQNTIFEKSDLTVEIPKNGLKEWAEESKKKYFHGPVYQASTYNKMTPAADIKASSSTYTPSSVGTYAVGNNTGSYAGTGYRQDGESVEDYWDRMYDRDYGMGAFESDDRWPYRGREKAPVEVKHGKDGKSKPGRPPKDKNKKWGV